MELQWTSKAQEDLTRLYEFLAPVNRPAAALSLIHISEPTRPY